MRYTADKDWERYFSASAKESGLFLTIKYTSIDLTLKDVDWLFDASTEKSGSVVIWDTDWLGKINSSSLVMIENEVMNKKSKIKGKRVRVWEQAYERKF